MNDGRNICPDCTEEFPSDAILHRHRVFEHPDAVEREAAERAQAREQDAEDDRFTPDGFLKATNRRRGRPSLFPAFPAPEAEAPPWERERLGSD